jgi:thymidine kinase
MAAKLHFRWGSMNTGKSTQLLQIAFNYEEGGHQVMLFTAAMDNRTQVGEIASRLGVKRQARTFDESTDFFALVGANKTISCLLIDEAQFLRKEHVRDLHRVAALHNVPVMCFGLRTDFQGVPFEGAAYLLALAEDLEEVKAICSCGRKSTMNMRVDDQGKMIQDGPKVLIGGNNRYRQVCARCYYGAAT